MLKLIAGLGLVVMLSGCASTAGTFFNRPVVEDQIGEVMHTVSLSADRRTVIVAKNGVNNPKFCAEPPPDTATALKTDLDSTLKYQGKELGIKDKLETTVTVLASRNAPLDAFRTGMFALCQFYLNGAIKDDKVAELFTQLLQTFADTQKVVNEAAKKPNGTEASANAGSGDTPESQAPTPAAATLTTQPAT